MPTLLLGGTAYNERNKSRPRPASLSHSKEPARKEGAGSSRNVGSGRPTLQVKPCVNVKCEA